MRGKEKSLKPFEQKMLSYQKNRNSKSIINGQISLYLFIAEPTIYCGKTLLADGDSINPEALHGQEHGSRVIHMFTTWEHLSIKAKCVLRIR